MSYSVKRQYDDVEFTHLRVKNQKENQQKLRRAAKNLDRIPNEGTCKKSIERTAVKQLEQLEILSVKADNGQVMIEFRAPSTSAPFISGTDGEMHTNQTNQDGFLAIKVEDEVDIKIEDEMEFCALNTTAQFMTGNEEHNNHTIQNEFTEINVTHEIEFVSTNITVQSIPTTAVDPHSNQTVHNEFTAIEDEMEFCDEVKINALNTLKTTTADKPDKNPIYYICDICSKKLSNKEQLKKHRIRHGKPKFHCTVCGVAKFTPYKLDLHMSMHDANRKYFTCDICPKKYTTKQCLIKHRSVHDTNRIYFTCDICSKQYTTKHVLSAHRLRHGKPNLHCTFCGVTKYTDNELDLHIRRLHTHRIYFSCDICPKKLTTEAYLKRHRLRHGKQNFHFVAWPNSINSS